MFFTRTQLSFIDRKRPDRKAGLATAVGLALFRMIGFEPSGKVSPTERQEHCRVTLNGPYARELPNEGSRIPVSLGVVTWRNTLMDLFITSGWDAQGR